MGLNKFRTPFCTVGSSSDRYLCATLISGLILILAGPLFLSPDRAMAVNITMEFQTGHVLPSFDDDGSRLIALMDAVALYYEDIFEGTDHDLQVKFYYDDTLPSNTIAKHHQSIKMDGHPYQCKIRFSSTMNWFIDDTPFDNSEFDMQQTICRDLDESEVSSRFSGDVPDLLEVEYSGTALSAPSTAIDMWTIALHEMGHGLGMTVGTALDDVGDYDYDFDNTLVWGHEMAAKCYSTTNRYHLKENALMDPYPAYRVRNLPAMIDILAMVDAGEWSTDPIDLPRKDFYNSETSADYNTSTNWSGNQIPDDEDEAHIRHGGMVTLSANSTARSLSIEGSSTLALTGHQLLVNDLIIDHGSSVLLGGGALCVTSGTVASGATVCGSGTIEIEEDFQLSGSLHVQGGNLTLQTASSSTSVVFDSEADVFFDLSQLASSHLTLNGEVDLGGATLVLSLLDGFTPNIGDQFDLFDWNDTLLGTFAEVIEPQRCTFDLSNLYTNGTITVLTSSPPIPGDANHDGMVNASDATILAGNWQLGVGDPDPENIKWEMGDFNGDGVVDASDATILAGNWQAGVDSTPTAVPEPSTMVLLLCLAVFGILSLRRRVI